MRIEHAELLIKRSDKKIDVLELRRADGGFFTAVYLLATSNWIDANNPIYQAMGCLECPLLKRIAEEEARSYGSPRTTKNVLGNDNARARPFSYNSSDAGRTVLLFVCELLNPMNNHPDLRSIRPPCLKKTKLSFDCEVWE
ncbi:MAG: hypothetical protein M1484_00020 [Patescibacteria group bacterium]|nr:hypothetical protein [Patescibacteria group bacterium]MCL5431466.1 hypothetical protein [Patescibacteria group bacterium]